MADATVTSPARRGMLQRALGRARRTLFPTTHERSYRRWVADRGDETRRFAYPLGPDAIVLDVGGYVGDWAARASERFGCIVHVFEPVPEFSDGLVRRFAGHAGVTVHPFGLAARTREERFALAADGSSALRGGTGPLARLCAASEVFERLGLARVDLMKVNIEGGEFELLEHLLDRALIGRIEHLQVQFHDFVPDAERRMKALQARLLLTHALEWQYEFVWESWRLRAATASPAATR